MYEERLLHRDCRADQFTTPCGRYWVEQVSADKFEVHGPDGLIGDFGDRINAQRFCEGEAKRNPVKPSRKPRR